ncbi:hypothetical protein [Natronomonas sp. EA1]|uniref:hypothetical protein n=1 Tax=Natronomonas sp. EA1 TaxID=3421655 RepID=UPI003EBF1C3D
MSDDQPRDTTMADPETDHETETHSDEPGNDADTESTRERFERYLTYAALGLFVLFALVAAVGVYTSIERAIGIWVTHEFRPFFRAGFNLVVLLLAVGGAARVLRRLD